MNSTRNDGRSATLEAPARGKVVDDHAPICQQEGVGRGRKASATSNAATALIEEFSICEEVGFIVRRVHQRIGSIFQDRMKPFDLTPPQFSALCRMSEYAELSQNQLGRLVNLDPATNQGVVRRLLKRGLIERRDDPNDRRRALLSLTDSGRDLLAQCMPVARRVSPTVLKPLTTEEQATLLELLRRLT